MTRVCILTQNDIPITDEQRQALIKSSNTNTFRRKYDARLKQFFLHGEPLDSFAIYFKIFTNWVGTANGEPDWDPQPAWIGTRESFEKIIGKF